MERSDEADPAKRAKVVSGVIDSTSRAIRILKDVLAVVVRHGHPGHESPDRSLRSERTDRRPIAERPRQPYNRSDL
jgi:hypothetical protein